MNDKNNNASSPNTESNAGNGGINKWLLIGGAVVLVLVLARLMVAIGNGSAQATPTPQPGTGVVAPFVGPVWEWTGTTDASGNTLPVSNPSLYTIQFLTNGTYQGKADCNSIAGAYTVNGSALHISPGPSSLVACPPGSLADQFTAQLFNVESFAMQGTDLILNLKGGAGKMQLHQSGAPANASVLVGPTWKWRETVSNGNSLVVPDPNQYTLQFSNDGKVQIKADCNTGGGVYVASSTGLQIQIQQMTRAACSPGSLSDIYVQQLNSAASYFTGGPDLVIQLKDTSQMMFGSGTFPTTVPPATIATVTPLPTNAPTTIAPTSPPACAGAPVIEFFTAQPPSIELGQNTVLRWGQVSNAAAVAIDQGVGSVSAPGSVIVAPAKTTKYIMTATGCGGQVQSAVTVTVNAPTATQAPTLAPTQAPTLTPPTAQPTQPPPPTEQPTAQPTAEPTAQPTLQPGADLIGTWKWTGATMNDGTKYTPSNPNQYTVTFQESGTLTVNADCNTGNGTYTTNGSSLSISIPVMTQALCPPESLSTEFVQLLTRSGSYVVQGSTLRIDLQADSGTMTFTK